MPLFKRGDVELSNAQHSEVKGDLGRLQNERQRTENANVESRVTPRSLTQLTAGIEWLGHATGKSGEMGERRPQ